MVILNKETLTGAIQKHETKEPTEDENKINEDSCSSCTKDCCKKSSQKNDWNENT